MTPTAGPGDSVIVAVSGEPAPRTGDIVAFHPPTGATCAGAATVALGRVVGLPGQTVEGGHGSVLVDGRRLAQPWLAGSAAAATGVFGPVTVPNGDYYLLGDDRAHACDSRQLGPLPGLRPGGRRGADRPRPPGVGLRHIAPLTDGVDTGLHNMRAQHRQHRQPARRRCAGRPYFVGVVAPIDE